MKLFEFYTLLCMMFFLSCGANQYNKNILPNEYNELQFDVLMIRNETTFIIESKNSVPVEEYIYENLAYFHYISHEGFDSLKQELNLNFEDRNSLFDLSKMDRDTLNMIVKKLNPNLIKKVKTSNEQSEQFIFKLNRKFWKETYNGDSYIEMMQDHGTNYLTEFKYFDNVEECITTTLSILDKHTSANRVNCENLEENIKGFQNSESRQIRAKNKILDKVFDGTCITNMFGENINKINPSTTKEDMLIFYEANKVSIELYHRYFESLDESPYIIMKL